MPEVYTELLGHEDCLTRLARHSLGRIGLSIAALPVVLPVNYAVHDGAILIRTAAGSKLDAATRGAVVAFEIDGFEDAQRSAWSVLVQGVAAEIVDPDARQRASSVELQTWSASGTGEHFVRIELTKVTGRRVTRAA